VLLSAGIGATPVLAMLYALGAARSTQQGVVDARDSRSAASSKKLAT
jgi:ferredoxin-NADP reductase